MFKFLKSLIISFILTLIGFFVLSILLSYTNLNEKYMKFTCYGIVSIAILIGGSIFANGRKEKGVLCGGFLAIIHMTILYVVSSIISKSVTISISSIIFVILGVFAGCIGGIFGVNLL